MKFLMGFIFTFYSCAPAYPAFVREGTSLPGMNYSRNFVINPEADKNIGNITVSAAIITRNTTTPLQAPADFSIDATASGQTVKFDTVTLDKSLKGQNCEAKLVFTGDASLYKAYVEQGSTKVTTDLQLTNETSSRPVSINFPCGDLTSNSHLVVESTSASAAAFKVDQVYTGLATNLSNVAQAQFVGSAYYATTASCTWSRTNAAMGAFATTAACPGPTIELNPGPGVIQTTDADLPRLTVTNIPSGQYRVVVSLSAYNNAAGATSNLSVSDGTTTSGQCIVSSSAASESGTCQIEANFSYTSDQATKTFEVYGASTSSTINIHNSNSLAKTRMSLYRYPSSAEIAVSINSGPSTTDWTSITVTPASGAFGTVTNGSYFARRVGDSLQVRGYFKAGTTAAGAATFDLSGYSVDTAKIQAAGKANLGTWETMASGAAYGSGNRVGAVFWNSGTSTFNMSSSGSTDTFGLTAGSALATTGDGVAFEFSFPVVGWSSPTINVPIIVGSVTSNSSGAERVERALVTFCASSPCTIASQSGTWLSSVTRASTGWYTLNFNTGIFSGAPVCSFTVKDTNNLVFQQNTSASSSSYQVKSHRGSTGTIEDSEFTVMCMGPR